MIARFAALGIMACVSLSSDAGGQAQTQVAFVPGGQDIFTLDFSGTRVGNFPRGIQRLSGSMEVVTKDGMPMLRASDKSEFLISLPRSLPEHFTIELDVIPKECCPPPDLTIEGTATINQGIASAHLLWTADASHGFVGVVGGARDNHEFPIPDDIRVTLPGALAHVGVTVEGNTIKMYTNGRELYSAKAHFARGQVLRISLGGVTEETGTKPVYLARIRVATGPPVTVAEQQRGHTGLGAESAPAVTDIVARVGPQGDASVAWSALQGATSYFVVRWKVDDPACCSRVSPPEGMNRLAWDDGVLPTAGTYAYRVYATTASGISAGEARVTYQPTTAAPPAVTFSPTTNKNPGTALPAARTIALSEFAAAGGISAVAPRTIEVSGITATGAFGAIAPRTIALAELMGTGPERPLDLNRRTGTTAAPAPRTIALAELLASGVAPIPPRTIALTAIAASGVLGALPRPRTIQLAGFTAVGPARTP